MKSTTLLLKRWWIIAITVFFVVPTLQCQQKINFLHESIQQKWKSPEGLMIPESVKYDSDRKVLYISNINGIPSEKDGNGFISKLSLDGQIIDLKWITGLDAPKGMGIFQDFLYVSNITEIVKIDILKGEIVKRYPAIGSQFLNDIDIDEKGTVFCSDMKSSSIYRIDNDTATVWISGEDLKGCNGLYYSQGYLFIGADGKILKADITTGQRQIAFTQTGSIDGLESYEKEVFLFSDYKGSVYKAHSGAEKELLLNTTSSGINAADIEYIPELKLLLVPTFNDNHVTAYQLL